MKVTEYRCLGHKWSHTVQSLNGKALLQSCNALRAAGAFLSQGVSTGKTSRPGSSLEQCSQEGQIRGSKVL